MKCPLSTGNYLRDSWAAASRHYCSPRNSFLRIWGKLSACYCRLQLGQYSSFPRELLLSWLRLQVQSWHQGCHWLSQSSWGWRRPVAGCSPHRKALIGEQNTGWVSSHTYPHAGWAQPDCIWGPWLIGGRRGITKSKSYFWNSCSWPEPIVGPSVSKTIPS